MSNDCTRADLCIACVDVDYRSDVAVAAAVWFCGWAAAVADHVEVSVVDEVAPYQPGEFYRRELPCLLDVLAKGPAADAIIVDGYVWLGGDRPGLGAHLYNALGERAIVVGVAKTRFAGATNAIGVRRGSSKAELFVTAAGADLQMIANHVKQMHGEYRLPTILKLVDRIARSYDPATGKCDASCALGKVQPAHG